jgi:aspartate/tyrosine/aromatic aminotransferase
MFEALQMAPPDPIMGITEAFRRDPNPDKINLSIGVFADSEGRTIILPSVKEAEARILDSESSKAYKPIDGAADFDAAARELLLGAEHPLIGAGRALTAHTPGGSGALRVVGDFLARHRPGKALWVSDPTWPNHPNIFRGAGLQLETYPYFDPASNAVAFTAMLSALREIPSGDSVLLHGCCHNPTGADPTLEQWREIAGVCAARGLLPVIDFAYQGFADGLEADAAGMREVLEHCDEVLVCSSFSKNFGLYSERTGALTVVAGSSEAAQAVMSQLKVIVRSIYSSPPSHGGDIVTTILRDEALRSRWDAELAGMRERINSMRHLLVDTLAANGVPGDHSFIMRQKGMFSFSGLTREQVQRLRDEHAIYIVGSGRINVAGVTPANVERLCKAIASVS